MEIAWGISAHKDNFQSWTYPGNFMNLILPRLLILIKGLIKSQGGKWNLKIFLDYWKQFSERLKPEYSWLTFIEQYITHNFLKI